MFSARPSAQNTQMNINVPSIGNRIYFIVHVYEKTIQ